ALGHPPELDAGARRLPEAADSHEHRDAAGDVLQARLEHLAALVVVELRVLAPAPGQEEARRPLVDEPVDVDLHRLEAEGLVVLEGGEPRRARAAEDLVRLRHVRSPFRGPASTRAAASASGRPTRSTMARAATRGTRARAAGRTLGGPPS